jgi:site-specific recombinase XerD
MERNMHEKIGWKQELQTLIDENITNRVNGKVASNKTQDDRASYLFKFFNDLRQGGFAVSPKNINLKHIKFICQKFEEDQLSAASIQTYLTHLRVFCRWIGKNGMMVDIDHFFNNPEATKRKYVASELKTWSAKDIDISQKLNEIKQDDIYVWIQLIVQHAFGLRRKEALFIRPYINFVDDNLHIIDGAKGGKARIVPIETELQKYAVLMAKHFVGKTSSTLMNPQESLKQNLKTYSNIMQKYGLTKKEAGVTGHWLRVEYITDFFESKGLVPAVKGGEAGQLRNDEEMRVRLDAAQRLGHNRVGVTSAYAGSFPKKT